MKVALLLCLLVASSQASFFDDLKSSLSGVGHALTDTFHQVGEQAKVVGSQLLETAKTQGSQLASQALQSLLMGTMNALSSPSSGSATKRDLNSLVNQASQLEHLAHSFLVDKTDAAHNAFNAAVDKLHELQQHPPTDLVHQVQQVLHNHHQLSQTFQHDLVEGLHNMFSQAFKTDSAKRDFHGDLLQKLDQFKVNLAAVFGHHHGKLNEGTFQKIIVMYNKLFYFYGLLIVTAAYFVQLLQQVGSHLISQAGGQLISQYPALPEN